MQHGTDGQHVSAEKPLHGAVLCCTSIASEERQVIADLAEQMGAEHELDLTSRVTHLLVGESGSEKYRFVAKNREDVKVLLPAWIQAVRERWIADEPLDMNALEAQYKVPTLYGLKICITGFEDYSFRSQLQKNVEENGAIYTGELTKENTHLIAAAPEGKKYEYANLWRLQIVSLKWYQDTLRRGMQLDETKYHPSLPLEQQGVDAWIKPAADATLGKRRRDDGPTQEASRKLRRTASARLGSQSDTIWSEIGRHSSDDVPPPYDRLRAAKSLPNLQSEVNNSSEPPETDKEGTETDPQLHTHNGFLSGCHFIVRGFDSKKLEKVHDVLQGHGAELHSSLNGLLEEAPQDAKKFVLVYHEVDKKKLKGIDEAAGKAEVVTELWLEWCMIIKRAVSVVDYPLGGVMQRVQVPQASSLIVNATGFQGIQTSHVSKVLARLGITYDETFTPKTNVLICCASGINAQKVIHAKQWQIPIVSDKWLWRMLSDQRIPSFEPFLFYKSKSQNLITTTTRKEAPMPRHESAKSSNMEHKTFRKLNEVDDQIPIHQDTDAAADREAGYETIADPETLRNDITMPHENAKSNDIDKAPLREISSNISPPKLPSPQKKLFRSLPVTSFDGAHSKSSTPAPPGPGSCENNVQEQPTISKPPKEHSDLVAEFLHLKAIAHTKAETTKQKSKKLLSRALSNVSNSSRTSAKEDKQLSDNKTFSRTSSINSINTDGLGAELSNSTRPVANPSLNELFAVRPSATIFDLSDPNLCREELEPSQQASQKQVTYEDSADAIALKAKLAEKRRTRGKLNPGMEPEKTGGELKLEKVRDRERNVIRDDDIALGNAERRVTRGREKLLEELVGRDTFFD